MTGVFVNYRSRDEVFAVELFDMRLRAVFGEERVFVDHRSLRPGEDFQPPLWDCLQKCAVLLVLIGPRWLDLTDLDGTPLLEREEDFVRREIREALGLKKNVIPVLLDGARLPSAKELPGDIAGLAVRQYLKVDRKNVEHDVERVVDAVREHVPVAAEPDPVPAPSGGEVRYIHSVSDHSQASVGDNSPVTGTSIHVGPGLQR
jgi:hypothetical protein